MGTIAIAVDGKQVFNWQEDEVEAKQILALGPSCVSATPQLKREWSLWPEFGLIPGNPCDLSKG
jgi:hypothetical protein